jgi:hypothetical protein
MRLGTLLVALFLLAPACSNSGSDSNNTLPPSGPAPAETAITTNLYDNVRSAATSNEKYLNTSNVKAGKFGLLFSRTIDGFLYGHVLYVPNVTIKGAPHNVIYTATQSNMIYAFDADDAAASAPLWSKQLAAPMPLDKPATLPDGTAFMAGGMNSYPSCQDLKPSGKVGVTATPVIDPMAKLMYVVSKSRDATGADTQQLHAFDLATGDEPTPAATISAPGFSATFHLNRPGLLLQDGVVYIGFGSHCDDAVNFYHGWIFAYDAKTLTQKGVYNATPTGKQAAIWQSGVGLTGDGKGGILAATGNGVTSKGGAAAAVGVAAIPATDDDGVNMIFSVVRVKLGAMGLGLDKYYFPANTAALASSDKDLATGVNVVPGGLTLAGGKEGLIYQLDSDTLKPKADPVRVDTKYDSRRNSVLHELAVWTGPTGPMIYTWPTGGGLESWAVVNGVIDPKSAKINLDRQPDHPGGSISVSSDGTKAGTGIVWATIPSMGDSWHATADGVLFAFDASDIKKRLWSSDDSTDGKDALGTYAKFSPPVVANGKVYVATFDGKIQVYGLK